MPNNRRTARNESSYRRKEKNRELRVADIRKDKIVISFKDFTTGQPGKNVQSFTSWENDKMLAPFIDTLKHLTELSVNEAKQQGFIKEYGLFPTKSDFRCPPHLNPDLRWTVLKKITGQKAIPSSYSTSS